MSGPSVLFIGGSGIISAACVREAVEQGFDVTVLNRGATDKRPIPDAVTRLQADVSDRTALEAAIGDQHWDVVIDFVAFTPDQVQRDIEVFTGRTNQYVFISSASAYQTPATHLPITESTPLKNPFWQYSRDKIACEDLLVEAYREDDFPMTIIRPSHTYDETLVPFSGGWTVLGRMRAGKPSWCAGRQLAVDDHARAGLRGRLRGAARPGRGDRRGLPHHRRRGPTWDRIAHELAAAAGVDDLQIVHVPSDAIDALDADWGASLLGDKANTSVFDNTKVQTLVPEFAQTTSIRQGAREIVAWFDADPSRQVTDERLDGLMDQLVERWQVR